MSNVPLTKADLDRALTKHSLEETNKIQAMITAAIKEATDYILVAFPDGPKQHREAHEQMIRAAKAEEAFWHDLKFDIAKKSIWGILHILFILALGTVAVKLGIGSVFGLGK
jgi:hypothetical protein